MTKEEMSEYNRSYQIRGGEYAGAPGVEREVTNDPPF